MFSIKITKIIRITIAKNNYSHFIIMYFFILNFNYVRFPVSFRFFCKVIGLPNISGISFKKLPYLWSLFDDIDTLMLHDRLFRRELPRKTSRFDINEGVLNLLLISSDAMISSFRLLYRK